MKRLLASILVACPKTVLADDLPALQEVDVIVDLSEDKRLCLDITRDVIAARWLIASNYKRTDGSERPAESLPGHGLFAFAWLALELISLRPEAGVDVTAVDEAISDGQQFRDSTDHATRELGYKIQRIVQLRSSPDTNESSDVDGPGGRHDNDFADFRRIQIYPTTDELLSTRLPFYRTAQEVVEVASEQRGGAHLDNQFRLMIEDMLAELRDDIQVTTKKKTGRRTAFVLGGLDPCGVDHCDASGRYMWCTLLVRCLVGLNSLEN